MELKPVKQTEIPKYPLKTELNDETLKKQIPKRWVKCPAAKIALGTLAVVTITGCAPVPEPIASGGLMTYTTPTEAPESVTPTIQVMPEGTPTPAMMNVAPLFVHGDGRGSFGCVMVAPPAFLSEDEALVVINDAAKEYGLEFTAGNGPVFEGVRQPVTDIYSSNEAKTPDTYEEYKLDFTDSEHGISIEYVSTNDVKNWNQGEQTISGGTYNTKDAAAQLSEALEHAYAGGYFTAAVLYDPCANAEPDPNTEQEELGKAREEAKEKAREMSEEQLAAQAKDFFEWLKSQGVI